MTKVMKTDYKKGHKPKPEAQGAGGDAAAKIAVLQLNLRVGDVDGNVAKLLAGYRRAVADGATLVVAPELAISGYPPKDNLLRRAFIEACRAAALRLAAEVGEVPLAYGTPWPAEMPGDYGQLATNTYVVARGGRIEFSSHKRYPAQGGVFDEWRVHVPGEPAVYEWGGVRYGFPICEDIWHDDVVDDLVDMGAEVFIVPNGSPGYIGKPQVRHKLVQRHVLRTGKPMLYLNHVGGQDEHGFEGGAFYLNTGHATQWSRPKVDATVFAPYWQEAVACVRLERRGKRLHFALPEDAKRYANPTDDAYALDMVVMTTRDYLLKSVGEGVRMGKVVIGISGGVDSAVVLALAVMMMRSAGVNPAEHIIAVSLPSRHNSNLTKGYAQEVCDNLGIPLKWWPIEDAVAAFRKTFADVFGDALTGVADENTQSRERGQVLMAIANQFNAMVHSTGNKSEMLMGYATLYGDMNGGFGPLKTLYKTQVFPLARTLNARLGFDAISEGLITQPPSAELAEGQRDDNSLPPYAVLDPILKLFVDEQKDVAEIMALGQRNDLRVAFVPASRLTPAQREELGAKKPMQRFWSTPYDRYDDDSPLCYQITEDCVEAVARQVMLMRYKRYQAPPGASVTPGSLDAGEDYPLANATGWLNHPVTMVA